MPTNTLFIAQNHPNKPVVKIYCTTWQCGPAYIYTLIAEEPVASSIDVAVAAKSGTYAEAHFIQKGVRNATSAVINYATDFTISYISPAADDQYMYVGVDGMPPFDISSMYKVITLSLMAFTSGNVLTCQFTLDNSWRSGQWVLPFNYRDGSMAGKNEEIYWSSGIRTRTKNYTGGAEPVKVLQYNPYPGIDPTPPVTFIIFTQSQNI
jgi:hypothetical protein